MDRANHMPREAEAGATPLRAVFAQILVALVHDINNALGIALGNAYLARDVLQGADLGEIGHDTVDSIALAASLTRIVSLYARCLPSEASVFDLRAALDQAIAIHDSKRNQGEHVLVKAVAPGAALVRADRQCLDIVLAMLLARATGIEENMAPTIQFGLRRVRRAERQEAVSVAADDATAGSQADGFRHAGTQVELIVRCKADGLPGPASVDAFESSMATDGMQEGVVSLWFAREFARAAGGDFWITRAPRAPTALLHLSLPSLINVEPLG